MTLQNITVVLLLALLEGILSVDNAIVLALLARPLPKLQQKKALTYGLFGAVAFRFLALWMISVILRWSWLKILGGLYLLGMGGRQYLKTRVTSRSVPEDKPVGPKDFWMTVAVIELTDITFAVDSILAAVALSNQFWVVFTGGCLGIMLMRAASGQFIQLLEKFPALEKAAYLMILVIGSKLVLEALSFWQLDFHSPGSIAFWIFWSVLALSLASGFLRQPGGNSDLGKSKSSR